MKPPAGSGTPWAEHYETLRRHVLEGRGPLVAEPLGLVLVCRRGLAGWMNAWRKASEPPPVIFTPPRRPDSPGWQRELTTLLAQMTVRQLSPA